MSEAPPQTCDADALLAEAAALDMALLRHVNAQALAATEPEVLNGLVRSQQRVARSLRTTLATRARLAARAEGEGDRKAPAQAAAAPRPFVYPWEERAAQNRAEAAARAAGEDAESALKAAVLERVRLEYDPAEVEAIDEALFDLIDETWEDGGFTRRLPADRLARMMGVVRKTFGPSQARPAAAVPTEPAEPTGPSEPREAAAPDARPPEPRPATPYVPPWERRPPHALDRGGGGADG